MTMELFREIEVAARRGYNRAAPTYDDPSHETLRNFETLLRDFLDRHSHRLTVPGGIAIDIGGGRGWLARRMAERGYRALLGDISDQMLRHARERHRERLAYCNLSAFSLPFRSGVANVLTTILCGAYLNREVVRQIHHVLAHRGTYIVAETPREWVAATHDSPDLPQGRTWFKDTEGEDVLLPFTFLYSLDELVQLVTSCGFTVMVAESLTPNSLLSSTDLSSVNKRAARAMGLAPEEVPMLSAVIARKM